MFPGAWTGFADAVLSQEAMLARVRFGEPDLMAGIAVQDKDLDDIVDELIEGDLSAVVRDQWVEVVDRARAILIEELGSDSPFAEIARAANLSTEEAEVLAVVCAVEVDTRRQRLMVFIQDDVSRMWPTPETLMRAFGPEHRGVHALAPTGRLRTAALVLPADDSEPWSRQTVRVEASVVWHLMGATELDPGLPPGTTVFERDDLDIDIPGTNADDAEDPDVPVLVLVTGDDRIRRRETAVAEIHADRFLVAPTPSDEQWPVVCRQATLLGAAVIVELADTLSVLGRSWIKRASHLSWAVSSTRELPVDAVPDRPWLDRRAESHDVSDDEWQRTLGDTERRGHRLSAEHVHLLRTVGAAVGGDIDTAVRRLASGLLDGLATRIRPRRSWGDLVLPEHQLTELHELCERYRRRDVVYERWGFQAVPSAGLVALFAGASGTGKTMTAEVIAGDLGLDLYRIDLNAITSKWVGETEKNLERIFSAASAGNLVLFFDEADAVFGKRSEVKESNDRYANMEVSYLLQRLETYDGLVILATNLQNNIDRAFMRRVHVSIDFQIPEPAERQRIWEGCLPAQAPRSDDLDIAWLAERFDIAGGNIRAAALTAAFLAASTDEPISMRHVLFGLVREIRKLGRLPTEALFGDHLASVQRTLGAAGDQSIR